MCTIGMVELSVDLRAKRDMLMTFGRFTNGMAKMKIRVKRHSLLKSIPLPLAAESLTGTQSDELLVAEVYSA